MIIIIIIIIIIYEQLKMNDLSGSVTSYNLTYSGNSLIDTSIFKAQPLSCVENICSYVHTVDVPSTVCPSSSDGINVSVSAVNRIGQGPFSDAVMIGTQSVIILIQNCSCLCMHRANIYLHAYLLYRMC